MEVIIVNPKNAGFLGSRYGLMAESRTLNSLVRVFKGLNLNFPELNNSLKSFKHTEPKGPSTHFTNSKSQNQPQKQTFSVEDHIPEPTPAVPTLDLAESLKLLGALTI